MLLGAIEAGGTKFVCGVGSVEGGSVAQARIETRTPDATMEEVKAFFREAARDHGPIGALGIASFGPLDLDRQSRSYGKITTTPKPGWREVDLPARMRAAFPVPIAIDTDVNAAALAERQAHLGDAPGTLVYVTVGTGIGVGIAAEPGRAGLRFHGEGGHLFVRKHPAHRDFAGICPYHRDCLEGLANGPAIIAAWGKDLSQLPEDHPAWEAESDYLGQLCASLILMMAPARIILGGGVLSQQRVLEETRDAARQWLAGYMPAYASVDAMERVVTAPLCPEAPGLVGAYMLAADALNR